MGFLKQIGTSWVVRVGMGAAALAFSGTGSQARERRFVATDPALWAELQASRDARDTWIVEFRAGDALPLKLAFRGDLLESVDPVGPTLRVRRAFFLRLQGQDVDLSLDGTRFQSISKALGGQITAGAELADPARPGGGVAEGLTITLEHKLKP